MARNCILYILFAILPLFAAAQAVAQPGQGSSKGSKKIEFINADVMEYDQSLGVDAMRLIGRVMMRHGDATMYADSAYRYMDRDAFVAFGQIHIEQGDSVDLYGDSLTYDGATGLAVLKGRVRMIDAQVNMESKSLTYDVKNNTGFYDDSATTRSKDGNILKSRKGTYYADRKEFVFTRNVTVESKDYTVFSDTMTYNTETEVSYFHGPTRIVSDENVITCKQGWYDTKKDICSFSKGGKIKTPEQEIEADSLYYERNSGFGLGFNNVRLRDSTQNIEVRGNYSVTRKNIDSYMVTDSVTLIMGMDTDSLFLSADSLFSVGDSLCGRILRAYHRVKFYKTDMQGVCDSLVYFESDSLLQMYRKPILWNEENQLTARFMQIFMRGKRVDMLDMIDAALIISKEDTIKFNQIAGKNMRAYFGASNLRKVDVKGRGETIYYPKEEEDAPPPRTLNLKTGEIPGDSLVPADSLAVSLPESRDSLAAVVPKIMQPGNDSLSAAADSLLLKPRPPKPVQYIGANKVTSEDITIHLDSGKVDRIVFKVKPAGNLSPFESVDLKEYKLPGFAWWEHLRPLTLLDIYSPRRVPKFDYMPKKKAVVKPKTPAKPANGGGTVITPASR
ncbi:MAG: hypothetical protein IBJ09_14375 [Bacteroidia bacterium]|nr:hypothetical protein [Bacteroidia bacterium]